MDQHVEASVDYSPLIRDLEASIPDQMDEHNIPGLAIALVEGTELHGIRLIDEHVLQGMDMDNEIVLRKDGLDRDMGYPSSEQLGDGSVLTVYYWHDEDQIRHLVGTRWRPDS